MSHYLRETLVVALIWMSSAAGGHADDQAAFAAQVKALLAREDYPATGVHDDRRYERNVRAHLRKVAKMTKANDGFANTLRYQGGK